MRMALDLQGSNIRHLAEYVDGAVPHSWRSLCANVVAVEKSAEPGAGWAYRTTNGTNASVHGNTDAFGGRKPCLRCAAVLRWQHESDWSLLGRLR